MQIGSGEFFQTLGQYVYAYIPPGGNLLTATYSGKGNGNRGISHIKTKGYDINDLYIVARNLERFDPLIKQDSQSFLLESFLIALINPEDNKVAGHYKECFVMSRFTTLFKEFQDRQHDSFAEFPQWYIENYEKLKGNIGTLTIKSETIQVWGQTRNSIAMSFYVNPITDEVTQCEFSIWNGAKVDVQAQCAELVKILADMGYDAQETGNRKEHKKVQIDETDIQKVIDLFYEFMS